MMILLTPTLKAITAIYASYKALDLLLGGDAEKQEEMLMKNYSKVIGGFHDDCVCLTPTQMNKLSSARSTNETRVIKGLTKAKRPLPVKRNPLPVQGSFAMKTIVQQQDNDFDIDIALIFNKEDLVGPQGGMIDALGARQMVRDALLDDRFKQNPVVHPNCVRVFYEDGFHVDMPVYRRSEDFWGEETLELASADGWKESDPEAVTKWFNAAVIAESPDSQNGRQLRRVVRLLKMWGHSRPSWNMPSGFIISVLVIEQYQPVAGRDDEALIQTMNAIYERLSYDIDVEHPILRGTFISEGKEKKVEEFRDRISSSLGGELSALFEEYCSEENGLKAWSKFFKNQYFINNANNDSSLLAAAVVPPGNLSFPDKPITPHKPGGFA